MATKRIHTDVDMQGNTLTGIATAAPKTNTQQAANTAFVTEAVGASGAKWLDIIGLQSTGLLSGVLGVDTTVPGSDFVWNAAYLPPGRSLFLEIYASGSATTTQVVASLYTAGGTLVANSAVATTSGTSASLARSAAFTLTDGQTYQLHFKSAILGTGTLKLARLIIL